MKRVLSPVAFVSIAVFCVVIIYIALDKLIPPFESSMAVIAQAKMIIETCSTKDKNICYNQELARITKEKNIQYAINVLHALQDIDPILQSCHVQAHAIANAATRKNPGAWKKLIKEANDSECGGGFLHGVLEVHIGYDPTFSITSASIIDVCAKLGVDMINHKVRTCSHFMGHLKLFETLGDIKTALPACKDLPGPLRLECDNGVFMEDSFKLTLFDHGLATMPVRDKARMIRQRARCYDYNGMESVACWTDLAEIFAELYNYDAPKTYEACERASNQEERRHCYLKAVIIMVASPAYDDMAKISAVCAPKADLNSGYIECIRYAISGATHYSIKLASRAAKLCSAVNSQFKDYCFKELGRQLTEVGGSHEEKLAICNIYPKFYNTCING